MDAAFLVLDILVRSALIAGSALALAGLSHRRSPGEAVAVLRAGVCLLLFLPAILAFAPSVALPLLPVGGAPAPAPVPIWAGDVGPVAGVAVSAAVLPPSPVVLAVWLWAGGALLVVGRFAVGVWTLRRWTRMARPATGSAWTATLARLGGPRPPRLLVSPAAPAPLSWGLPPGVVLIDPVCHTRPETAAAVLAHELAHVRNRDWLFLALSRLALALFWFNPLVWILDARLAARTEEAADAAALAEVEPVAYARTLVSLAADGGAPAALAMAGPASTLARRIACIMKTRPASPTRPLVAALTIAGLVAVATPIAAIELAPRPPAPPAAQPAPPVPPAPPAPPSRLAMPAPPAPPAPPRLEAGSQITITDGGRTRVYRSVEDMDPETRRAYEQALEQAAGARAQAAEAREQARAARAEGARARSEARVHHAAAMEQARAATSEARAAAAEARVQAAAARGEVRQAMARARVEMRQGADEMDRGADEMREEGRRLRDPAYRARQIERARERGDRVPTDAELLELSRDLPQKADELEAQARRLREEAEGIG
ncbi:M56 family metallopeptidase [Brevundimonas viscosa]|uniref:Signal transducer regulating beta-lactamase production, contains metallopeptidase domain n=1 Tax=Brevundimonas viscosa TaxID=871741 RepID=A0A1I6T1M9_9CAUL|nr:M56 family metallopeptidase [Brevundimonas viscosa]SFS83122.1 Signal transducer regulating beta-lactamase production, contains metallopeptidase domain [Brevundimonas viscosa]